MKLKGIIQAVIGAGSNGKICVFTSKGKQYIKNSAVPTDIVHTVHPGMKCTLEISDITQELKLFSLDNTCVTDHQTDKKKNNIENRLKRQVEFVSNINDGYFWVVVVKGKTAVVTDNKTVRIISRSIPFSLKLFDIIKDLRSDNTKKRCSFKLVVNKKYKLEKKQNEHRELQNIIEDELLIYIKKNRNMYEKIAVIEELSVLVDAIDIFHSAIDIKIKYGINIINYIQLAQELCSLIYAHLQKNIVNIQVPVPKYTEEDSGEVKRDDVLSACRILFEYTHKCIQSVVKIYVNDVKEKVMELKKCTGNSYAG